MADLFNKEISMRPNVGAIFLYWSFLIQSESQEVKTKYELSEDEVQVILRRHLAYRAFTEPSASDMMFLTWHEELAKEAEAISRRCLYEHSQLKSDDFKFVGENIYLTAGVSVDDEWFTTAVDNWAAESKNLIYDEKCTGKCVHYNQVVWATTHKLGCGLTICDKVVTAGEKEFLDAALFVCRYGPAGNVKLRINTPYVSGSRCLDCELDEKCVLNSCANTKRDGITDYSKWQSLKLANPNSATSQLALQETRLLSLLCICVGSSLIFTCY